jgi:DGQHR domain-containing protein
MSDLNNLDLNRYMKVDFIELKQPIGNFFIAKIPYRDLIAICYSDVRKIKHEGDFESYLGIQRELDPKRVKNLQEYVHLSDASFPSSIILSISNKKYAAEYSSYHTEIDNVFDDDQELDKKYESVWNVFIADDVAEKRQKMFILRDEGVAKIIDGQHRIEGLRSYNNKNGDFDVNVTVFMEMDIEEQAIVFATINKAQTKVNKSMVYDLYDLAKSRSPQKTCHNIAKFLNKKDGSPFLDKIKILGKADDGFETITQATFVECLMPYISKNPDIDRDIIKTGGKIEEVSGRELQRQIFRNLFIQKRDAEIAKNLFNYFTAVKNAWPIAWEETQATGYILNKSTGLVALFRFLSDVYLYLSRKENNEIDLSKIGNVYTVDEYRTIFDPLKEIISDNDFTTQNFDPGGSGRSQLYHAFKQKSIV